jgi:hypothetical protein
MRQELWGCLSERSSIQTIPLNVNARRALDSAACRNVASHYQRRQSLSWSLSLPGLLSGSCQLPRAPALRAGGDTVQVRARARCNAYRPPWPRRRSRRERPTRRHRPARAPRRSPGLCAPVQQRSCTRGLGRYKHPPRVPKGTAARFGPVRNGCSCGDGGRVGVRGRAYRTSVQAPHGSGRGERENGGTEELEVVAGGRFQRRFSRTPEGAGGGPRRPPPGGRRAKRGRSVRWLLAEARRLARSGARTRDGGGQAASCRCPGPLGVVVVQVPGPAGGCCLHPIAVW